MNYFKVLLKAGIFTAFLTPFFTSAAVITIDNLDAGFTSSGFVASTANCCVGSAEGSNYMVHRVGTTPGFAMWDPTDNIDWVAGIWKVEINWTSYFNRSKDAAITVNHSAGAADLTVNQRFNGGVWRDLGNYTFNKSNASVIIDGGSAIDSSFIDSSFIIADAVRFTLVKASISDDISNSVPEASSFILLCLGLAGVAYRRRKA